MSRRRTRHYRRNPVISTWLLVGGAAALVAWFATRKASAATPAVPAVSDADCAARLQDIAVTAQAVRTLAGGCATSPDPAGCAKNQMTAYSALEAKLTNWAATCGKPQPSSPVNSTADCLKSRSDLMQQLVIAMAALETQCKADPTGTSAPCNDLRTLQVNMGTLIPLWAQGCAKTSMPLTQRPG